MEGCEFRVLGGTAAFSGGDALPIPAAKQRALLAVLLIHRSEVVAPDRLLDAVWGEEPPASGLKTLRYHISKLRQALGPCGEAVAFRNGGYVLDVPAESLDSERFEDLLGQAQNALSSDPDRAALLSARALELWTGSAFADCAYEEFVQSEVRRLEELRLAAIELHNDAELAAGRADTLVPDLEALVVEHPLREALWAQLMYALYQTGRQPEALRSYRRATEGFAELGTVPSGDLDRLEELILLRDPALDEGWPMSSESTSGEAPTVLPPERTPFVGRTAELRIGTDLLSLVRLLTVLGPPGAGKTRLACQLGAENGGRYRHGVFFVPLAAVDDAVLVEPAIAQVLGVRGGPEQSTHESLVRYLQDRSLLLILDNLEQISGVGPIISELLDAAPQSTILATSRVPLAIHGEQALPIGPLDVPEAGASADIAGVLRHDASALFVARARAADPTFEVTDENANDLAHIVRELDGLPLAIELAAARIKMLGPAAMRGRLDRQLDLLTGGPQDVVDHHQTLRSAILWSYELLDEKEQRFFRSLGVFHGFSLEAAAVVTDLSDPEVFDEVASLLDKSLVYRDDADGWPRYALLESIREFARGELEANGELRSCSERQATYFAQLVGEYGPMLTTAGQKEAIALLTREIDNIRDALRFATDAEQPDLGVEIADHTWRLWDGLGQADEGRQWLCGLLGMPSLSPAARARGLWALASLQYWHADYKAAWASYEEALALFRSLGDSSSEAYTLYAMSMTATWDGDGKLGEELAIEALELLQSGGASDDGGLMLMARAWATQRRGRFVEARPLWDQALSRARHLGDEHLVVTQLIGIAVNEFHIGDRREALRVALEALERAFSIRNMQVTVWALDVVASLAVQVKPEVALRLAASVEEVRRTIGGGMPVEPLDIERAPLLAASLVDPEVTIAEARIGALMDWEHAYAFAYDSLRDEANEKLGV